MYFLDYFPWVLLISGRTYPQVQYEGGNKTRVGSNNFSLVQRVPESHVHHRNAHDYMVQILGTYSAVQCVSTDQLDKWSESSKASSLPAMSVAV